MKIFGKWLDNYRRERGLTIADLARQCEVTPSYMHLLIKGEDQKERTPSLDMLFRFADKLEVPYEELALQFVTSDPNDPKLGDIGKRSISFIRINNERKKKKGPDGLLTGVKEAELKRKYPDYNPDKILMYVQAYLRDVVYKDDYEEYKKEAFLESLQPQEETPLSRKELMLKEIMSSLYDLDENSLEYIEEQVNVFIAYLNKNQG